MKPEDICAPVAAELRSARLTAALAQLLKIGVWALMLWLVAALEDGQMQHAAWAAALMPLFAVAHYTLKIRAFDQAHYAAFRLEVLLRERLSAKAAALPPGTLQVQGAGDVAKILTDDVHALHSFVADAPPLQAEAYITPPLLLCLFDWPLALSAAALCAVSFLAMRLMMRRGRQFRAAWAEALGEVNRAIVEYVQGMAAVRVFDGGETSFGRYRRALARYGQVMQDWLRISGRAVQFARVLFTPWPLFVCFIILMIGYRQDAYTWFAFFLLAGGIVETLHPYMGLHHILEQSRAAAARIRAFEALPELPQGTACAPRDNTLALENVSFAYSAAAAPVLANISFTIPAGSFTALTGASGSGKSTLALLLARFFDPQQGRITLGATDIRTIADNERYKRISMVFQDNFLFSCSIADNIRYGIAADDDAVREAARQAHIHDFIMSLPQGYDTPAGEHGRLLSGGQRQRIAIARAILQNRPILIMDEPTAFTDARHEAQLLDTIRRLRPGRTLIMIAHRLHSIIDADQIVLMDGGKIAAIGSHAALLADSAPYRSLWEEYRAARTWKVGHGG